MTWPGCDSYQPTEATKALGQAPMLLGVDPRDFGAFGNGSHDDAPAFALAIEAAMNTGRPLIVPPGTWRLATVIATSMSADLAIQGWGRPTIRNETSVTFTAPTSAVTTLGASALRGARTIQVASSAGMSIGQICTLVSTAEGDTSWHTTKKDIGIIEAIPDGMHVTLDAPLLFTYTLPAETVTVTAYQQRSYSMQNVRFSLPDVAGKVWQIYDCKGVTLTDVAVEEDGITTPLNYGITLGACVGCHVRNLRVIGLYYGLVTGTVRDLLIEGIYAAWCVHPVAPSNWSRNITIRNLFGWQNQSTMDGHPAFNVEYDGVIGYETSLSNLRSVGAKIRNAYIESAYIDDGVSLPDVAWISSIPLVDMTLYDSYDVALENVTWLFTAEPDMDHVGIAIFYGRHCKVDGFRTNAIFAPQYYAKAAGGCEDVTLRNLDVYQLWCQDADTFKVSDSHIVGKGTQPAIRGSRALALTNVIVENVTYVVGDCLSASEVMRFANCQFHDVLTGFGQYHDAIAYKHTFVGCVFDNVAAFNATSILNSSLRAAANQYLNGTPELLAGTVVWDPGSIAQAAQLTTTISVAGAVLGDRVDVSCSIDLLALTLTGYVSVAGTVTIVLANLTGAAKDLASATYKAQIIRT